MKASLSKNNWNCSYESIVDKNKDNNNNFCDKNNDAESILALLLKFELRSENFSTSHIIILQIFWNKWMNYLREWNTISFDII